MKDVQFDNDDLPEEFQEWMEEREEDLDANEKRLWNFHRWMRQETDLSSGTIVDYLKDIASRMKDGDFAGRDAVPANIEKTSAVKKYEEFLHSNSTSKTETSEVEE